MKKLVDYMNLSKKERQEHINLEEPCIVRGTTSTHCRGILSYYLDTDINTMRVDCCHACNNEACSNPKHLYWGTRSENIRDLHKFYPSVKQKYGSKGNKNGQFEIKPWRNVAAISTHPEMKKVWASCIFLYENYFLKKWNFSEYGKGGSYFQKEYGFSRASISKIWKMFLKWDPRKDEDYLSWLKELDKESIQQKPNSIL
jgi:hypothetical protein